MCLLIRVFVEIIKLLVKDVELGSLVWKNNFGEANL